MFLKSHKKCYRPDTQVMFTPISLDLTKVMTPNSIPGAMMTVYQLRPDSTGSIHITSSDPAVPPKLDPGFLKTEHDKNGLVASVRRIREILGSSSISSHLTEVFPGKIMNTDEEILNIALNYGATGYHALGTTAMGPEEDDVVDHNLKVRGVESLRVIDASFFRHQPAGNNNAATMAGAWIAADIIISERTKGAGIRISVV